MTEEKEPSIHEPYLRSDQHPFKGQNKLRNITRFSTALFIGVMVFYVLVLMPLPYYIFKPGSAEQIRPMVHVKQEGSPKKGAFMLTTVGVSDASMIGYVLAKFDPNEEIHNKTEIRQNGESEKEYSQRQEYVMLTSQSSAMQAAYAKAKIPYHIHSDGVIVLQTLTGMAASKVLQAGDYITEVDGTPIQLREQLLTLLQNKKAGDSVKLTYKHGDKMKTEVLILTELPVDPADMKGKLSGRAGIGIVPADVQTVRADQEEKQVTIKAGDIGGPSAGLMFSLEIYNQLLPDDITKGYRIAGTGTITPQGLVGPIGGIQHKIVAADREKADIFFAPKDIYPSASDKFEPILNATDALNKANKINTKMKVVPVGTMEEALAYLAALPTKAS